MPEKAKYHQRTLDYLGIPFSQSPERLRLLDELEAQLGVALPEAFREWYALENGQELLEEAAGMHFAFSLVFRHSSERWLHWLDDTDPTFLYVLLENQGVWHMALRLSSNANPEVCFRWNDAGEPWQTHAQTFGDFVFALLWDQRVAVTSGDMFSDEYLLTEQSAQFQEVRTHGTLLNTTWHGNAWYTYHQLERYVFKGDWYTLLLGENR